MAKCFAVRLESGACYRAIVGQARLEAPVSRDDHVLTMFHTVSQFTLLASTKKGNKPDFHKSANAAKGKELYDTFFSKVRSLYCEDKVKDGVFQAMMDVGLVNDGPVGVDFRCIDEAVCMPQHGAKDSVWG